MRRFSAKKSRRRNGSEGPVSLFPFLAVLICTMGSLILLLVVIARQARLQASERPLSDHKELRAEIDRELEMARLQALQYDESREATNADLENARLKLGQVEDHSSELRRQLAALKAAWEQLDQLESSQESAKGAAESELVELAIRIQQLQREVDLAKVDAEGRQAAYSIVPYEGPHGTKRRPIYIECRADGLVLQPEGVYFRADDFEGPLDAGNPLDVGLRAVREYIAVQGSILETAKLEPYPLLLVRPTGIAYFYAGRTAMKSWGTEFGYELIGEDWELDFSEPDPVLARAIQAAVEPARERQRRLIAAAPSRYGSGGDRPVYTVKPYRGGITSRGGGGDSEEPSPLSLRPSGSHGRPGSQFGQHPPGSSQAGPFEGGRAAGGHVGQKSQSFFGQGGRPSGEGTMSPAGGGSSQQGEALGEYGSGQTGGANGSSGEACENAGGQPSAGSPGQNSEASQSLAKTRGRNWGLPDANRTAVAITRPVRVECHADRLVIVPETGLGRPNTISLDGGTAASIDTFVSSVWDYMERWGRAGRGMYWRPVLKIYLGPGADPRIAELETLLQDSGLLVEQAGRLTVLR
jgi:hypothetical protein